MNSDGFTRWQILSKQPRLVGNYLRRQADRPTIYFTVHNRNHLNLVRQAAGFLASFPVRVEFCVPVAFPYARFAIDALNEHKLPWIPVPEITGRICRQDAIIVLLDDGPAGVRQALARARVTGAATIALVEGYRFAKKEYLNVDHVLVWGPIGHGALLGPRNHHRVARDRGYGQIYHAPGRQHSWGHQLQIHLAGKGHGSGPLLAQGCDGSGSKRGP